MAFKWGRKPPLSVTRFAEVRIFVQPIRNMAKATVPLDNPVAEARRYLDNAREILSEKAGKAGNRYTDPKYVKMAGNTAYNGILVALDAIITHKTKGRKSVEHYQRNIKDKALLQDFNDAYNSLHLAMGYDGNTSYGNARDGLKYAEDIITYVETRTVKNP
jgi:hypothetical protein